MQQKLTNEEIQRVWGMYINSCELVQPGGYNIPNDMGNLKYAGYDSVGKITTFLSLTPLSAITDEHCIEAANLIWHIKDSHDYVVNSAETKFYIQRVKDDVLKSPHLIYTNYLYLISLGYDVPLWFSVDHLANGKSAIELNIAIPSPLLGDKKDM